MNIVFYEYHNWEKLILKKALLNHNLTFINGPLTEKNVKTAEKADIACIFIYSKITDKLLEKLPKLKYLISRSTGYDHINVKACKNKNVLVSNIPYYGENTVAEHAFALLLGISRRINKTSKELFKKKVDLDSIQCFDLKRKTLGVIGAGHIGINMIKMALGFQMEVIAYDIYKNKEAKKLGFNYVSLNELLKRSDIISIHALLTEKTKHLINKNAISKMKKGVVLINTARGEIIDTNALIEGLKNRKIRAAGLDVFENEYLLLKHRKENNQMHYLLNHENVIITPHMAFYSAESLQRIIESTIESINSFTKNNPINLIN